MARLLPVLEGLGLPPSRQRLVLNYNYKPFLGNLRPSDIGYRLERTPDYVIPYDKRILVSMNTGSPQILHAKWWQPFGRTINELIRDVDGVAATGAEGIPKVQVPIEDGRPISAHRPGAARIGRGGARTMGAID